MELSSDTVSRLWEVITFRYQFPTIAREFLLDRSPIEEIMFYLHCRNLLFEGRQTHKLNYSFEVIHYVTWRQAYHGIGDDVGKC